MLLGGGNVETSSQVARSIVSGLFRRMPRVESETTFHVSSPNSGPGSHVSHVSTHHAGSHVDQIEEEVLGEIEMQAEEVIATKSVDGSGEKILAETFSDAESELSESAKKLEHLSKDGQSFTKRINEWIKTVSIRDDVDTVKKNYNNIVHNDEDDFSQTSTPEKSQTVETNNSLTEQKYDDHGDVSELEDDQPSGLTSPAPVLMVSNFTDVSDDQEDTDNDNFEELKRKFQAERSSFVPISIIPTVALQSFEQGFANVQKSNGNILFDNGIGRNKLMSSGLPMSCPNLTKNYHFKVLETTEQKMKILSDGTREVDTTHTREHSEKVYDEEGSWTRCNAILRVLLVIILLSALFIGYFYRVHERFELFCHLSHSHDSIVHKDDSVSGGKVSIEL